MTRRIKWPAEVVERARQLYDRGLGYFEVSRALRDEGHDVSWHTVRDWCSYRTRGRAA